MSIDKIEKIDADEEESSTKGLPRILVGVIVVLIGVLFLLRNLGFDIDLPIPRNWWALFILIPAILAFVNVHERIKRVGRFDTVSGGQLTGGIAMTLVAVMFLAELSFRVWWPLFVILGGLAILLNHRWTRG